MSLAKLDAVERQIDTAIWLWFNDGDIVSIVTLTGAALGVLDNLFQHKKKGRPIPFTGDMAALSGLTLKQAINMVKADETFAKHARTDPEKTREYSFDRASAYLLCAVAAYYEFTQCHGETGTLRGLSSLRYGMMHPTLYDPPRSILQTPQEHAEIERLKCLSRREFFYERGKDFVGFPPIPDCWPDDRHSGSPPGRQ